MLAGPHSGVVETLLGSRLADGNLSANATNLIPRQSKAKKKKEEQAVCLNVAQKCMYVLQGASETFRSQPVEGSEDMGASSS